jgi:hypothetical protein
MIALLLILIVGYVLEPLWRMRAITLIAMMVTTWLKEYAAALAVTFIIMVMLLLVQSALLLGVLQPFVRIGFIGRYRSPGYGLVILAQFLGAGLMDMGLYLLFKAVRQAAFWTLKRVAFRSA